MSARKMAEVLTVIEFLYDEDNAEILKVLPDLIKPENILLLALADLRVVECTRVLPETEDVRGALSIFAEFADNISVGVATFTRIALSKAPCDEESTLPAALQNTAKINNGIRYISSFLISACKFM